MKIGSTIIYGTQVCRITDKAPRTFGKVTRDYYVLTPVSDERNAIFVPADNENLIAKMKKILSPEEIKALIATLPREETPWIDEDKERAVAFKEIMDRGDRKEIMLMIKALFTRKQELEAKGRRLHSADEMMLSRAERVIYEEFSLVLDIKKEDVVPFITAEIEE